MPIYFLLLSYCLVGYLMSVLFVNKTQMFFFLTTENDSNVSLPLLAYVVKETL